MDARCQEKLSMATGGLFYLLRFRGLTFSPKNTSSVIWDYEGVFRVSMQLGASGHFLCSLHNRIRAIVQPEGSHMPYQAITAILHHPS